MQVMQMEGLKCHRGMLRMRQQNLWMEEWENGRFVVASTPEIPGTIEHVSHPKRRGEMMETSFTISLPVTTLAVE